MSKRKRISPVEDATKHILSGKDKPCFEERFINSQKGRGVFASMSIDKGCFILEYRGELLSKEESQIRQNRYNETENTFLFDFDWNGRQWSIDASKEDGSLGRLVNDKYKTSNCKMKKIGIEGKPHLCLFSIKDIASGEELTYNYGDSNWPWRTLVNRAAPRSEENTPSEEGTCLPTKMNRSPKPTEQIGSHLSEPRPSNSDQCTDRNSDHSSTASDTTENHSQVNRAVPRCEENTPSEEGSCLPTKMNRSPKPTEQIGSHLSEPRPSNSDQCTDRNSDHSSTASDTTENHSQVNRAVPRCEENTPSEEGSCLPTKMNRSPKPTEQIGSHLSEPRPSNSDQCTDRNSDHSSTASDTTENHSQVNRAVPRCEENTPSEEGSCLPTKMNRSPKPTEQIGSHLSEPRPSNSDQCTDRNSDHSSTASDTTENHSQVNRAVPRCEENTPSEEGSCLPTKMNRSPKPTEQIGSHLSEPRPSNSDQCTDRNSDHSSTASDTTENHSQVNRAVPRCEENTPSEEGSCLPTKMNRSPKPTEQAQKSVSKGSGWKKRLKSI